ncbi:MAG: glycosyltransferase [Candidatus Jordarchaeum sp.]|uniref:glycosyltransferase n=1 Tax=Candidatus Jordarchaeum sp. TaxID=2823881 RepID=UPI0040494CAB
MVLCPTNEGYGHVMRAGAIASRLTRNNNTDCLVFSDKKRVRPFSNLNLTYNISLHGVNYVYRKNGDLNTALTVLRLLYDGLNFPLDFLKCSIMSMRYDVLINDYNPHLTYVPRMRTINISHYLPYKYKWYDLRMNFYTNAIEVPIVFAERARSFLRISESFIMDFRPEIVDCEKIFPPIVRDLTKSESQIRRELELCKRERLVTITGRPYKYNRKERNDDLCTYRRLAYEHPDIYFLVILPVLDSREIEDEPPRNLKVMGYVPHIHNYINASDLIISRSGFGTISEAVIYGVPLLIFPAKSHMEKKKNQLMVQDYGFGKIVENLERDIINMIEESDYNNEILKLGNGLNYFMEILNENYF